MTLLRGAHAALDGPVAGETYVAGLDVAGEGEGEHDATVLTVGRFVAPTEARGENAIEVVRHYAWTGVAHAPLHQTLVALLREWRVARVVVDATGIGEPVAAFLARALGPSKVESMKLTAESKSRLGYGLLTAVNGGRLRLYSGEAEELRECRRQIEACRANYRPNQTMRFYVDERDGHDDYVVSLALTVAAAAEAGPRPARGRIRDE